jgi:hypothetical protein
VTIKNAEVGFKLVGDDSNSFVGSVSIMDSAFSDISNAAIVINAPADKPGSTPTGLILDNVNLGGKSWIL